MNKPWLSVIMPTYNGEKYISATLDSIAMQKNMELELIIVDDDSTDSTLEIVKTYQKIIPTKRFSRHSRNWVANTNFALSLASGVYVCFLHQDDVWLNNRVETLRNLTTQSPEIGFIIHPSNFIDNAGHITGTWKCPLPPYPYQIKPDMITKRLLIQNFISIPGTIFKRDLAVRVNGMDENLWYTADWDFWLKIARCTDTIYYPIPLSGFRIHTESQTVRGSSFSSEFRTQLEVVLSKHIKLLNITQNELTSLQREALFSIRVNTSLANKFNGQKAGWIKLIISFISLNPIGWYRYFRDSRIWERVTARLRSMIIKKITL